MKKLSKLVFMTLVMVLAFATSAFAEDFRSVDAIKASGEINIGVFSDKNPFGYVDENGEYQGYDVYFAKRIGEDLGVGPFGYLVPSLLGRNRAANQATMQEKFHGNPSFRIICIQYSIAKGDCEGELHLL